jgi:hypothetical protein
MTLSDPKSASLAAVILVVSGFCANTFPNDPPVELKIKLQSKKKAKFPVPRAGGRRRDDDPDDPTAEGGLPTGSIRQPACCIAVIATLLQSPDEPLQADEILEKLNASKRFREFGLSSVQKALQDLGALKLVTNKRGKGYTLAT